MAQTIEDLLRELKDTGFALPKRPKISVDNARVRLAKAIQYALQGEQPQWLPEYEEVADWLTDNKGRGLMLAGACGRGKTVIAARALPLILIQFKIRMYIFDAAELNTRTSEALRCYNICIDDLGKENESVKFGERRNVFVELMDSVEKQGKLLICTTNLTHKQIEEKYGTHTLDRIYGCCRIIEFSGDSFRL